MNYRQWGNTLGVYDHHGRQVGDIWAVIPSGNHKFFHMAESFDPVQLDADDLREIADKLDELNSSEV